MLMMIIYIITYQHIFWSWIGDYPWSPIVLCRELETNITKCGPFLARGTWSRSNYNRCQLPLAPCTYMLSQLPFVNWSAPIVFLGFGMSLPLYPITFFGQKFVTSTCLWLIVFWQVQWSIPFILARYKIIVDH